MNFEWQIPHLTQEKLNRTLAKYFLKTHGTSLAIQQLRIRASTTEDTGSIPGHEMKIPYAAQGGGKRVGGQGSESSVLNITNFKIHHNESLSLQLTLEPYIYTHTHNYRNKWNLSYLKESFLVAQTVRHLPTMRETWVWSLGWEDPLEKEMATHSSTLAWKIPWTEELGRLQSMGSQRVGHDWATSPSYLNDWDLDKRDGPRKYQ